MSKSILISRTLGECRVALLHDGVPVEILVDHQQNQSLVGTIYLGKVERVLMGVQSAFVQIGQEKTAFLHFADVPKSATKSPPTKTPLQAGEWVMVQVTKDAVHAKGARLTTDLALSGHYLVYLPLSHGYVGASNKLDSAKQRRLKKTLRALLNKQFVQGGLVARSNAAQASEDELSAEVERLLSLWQQTLAQKAAHHQSKSQFVPLYQRPALSMRCLLDWADVDTQIVIDDEALFQDSVRFCQTWLPFVVPNIMYHAEQTSLFDSHAVEAALQNALRKRVELKLGGYLLIEQTEAMTTIDVNTGSFVGKHSLEQTAYQINLQATQVIAHQLRLRNIGGIVIVDFIDMSKPDHREQVVKSLKAHLASDPAKTNIVHISPLGLVEMTRKRTAHTLVQQLCQPCAVCQGTGVVRRIETVSFEICRKLMVMARTYPCQSLTVITDKAVAEYLQTTQIMTDLALLLNKTINIKTQQLCHGQYSLQFA